MREIKFRGKRTGNGEWVCGLPVNYCNKTYVLVLTDFEAERVYGAYPHEEMWPYEVVPETVGQYTGLRDRNGKEIYEGDIVREHMNDYTPIYQNGIYMAYNVDKINDPYISTQFNVIWRNGCEVIGNIYDNPERIGKKK